MVDVTIYANKNLEDTPTEDSIKASHDDLVYKMRKAHRLFDMFKGMIV